MPSGWLQLAALLSLWFQFFLPRMPSCVAAVPSHLGMVGISSPLAQEWTYPSPAQFNPYGQFPPTQCSEGPTRRPGTAAASQGRPGQHDLWVQPGVCLLLPLGSRARRPGPLASSLRQPWAGTGAEGPGSLLATSSLGWAPGHSLCSGLGCIPALYLPWCVSINAKRLFLSTTEVALVLKSGEVLLP